ncbi:MAG: recombination regulator RecX [Acidobacteria bacterium]|nr:recombination regulator RecX [Acidobacteriota bacterium]
MPAPAGSSPSAYQRALRRLARRDHSEAELRRALATRGHSDEEIDEAMSRLRAQRYVDDDTFAERFARSRLSHYGQGQARIRQGLRLRGVGREEIENGLVAALEDVSEDEVLDRTARRYWRQHTRVEPARRLPRLWAFLLRRGFAPGHVRRRLLTLWPRWSDALEGLEPAESETDDGIEVGPDR